MAPEVPLAESGRPYTFVRPADAIQTVNVGTHEDWITYRDHPPMNVELCL